MKLFELNMILTQEELDILEECLTQAMLVESCSCIATGKEKLIDGLRNHIMNLVPLQKTPEGEI